MHDGRFTRRRFLTLAAHAAAVPPLLPGLTRGVLAAAAGVPAGVIVRNDWPEHWESSLAALDASYLTPRSAFFVRSHLPAPDVDVADWRLEVSGLIERPQSLSLAELKRLPATTLDATLECAGNGRALHGLPSTSGTQWERGAVGNARWSGVHMAALLARAGVKPEARHVWLECADLAPVAGAPPYLRSLPIERATRDVLLAWGMNGAPLPLLHGAPLRAIVPGWFAMSSAKWLVRLRLEAEPSSNHFMARGYHYNHPGADPATALPVEAMRVKSLITWPREGMRVLRGALELRGVAWTGEGTVSRVEVSVGDGDAWTTATLIDPPLAGAWRRWSARLAVKPGTLTLRARATDSAGEVQPFAARANAGGYGNNSVQTVSVHAS